MDRKQKIDELAGLIGGIVDQYARLNDACRVAEKAGCLDAEGALFRAIWNAFEHLIDRIEEQQTRGWLWWFIYENDCGARGFEASVGGRKLIKVRKPRDLARLIVWDEERDG